MAALPHVSHFSGRRVGACGLCAGALALAIASLPAQAQVDSSPLAPRSGPRGKTMLVEMPPEATGIHTTNNYDDPRMWGALAHEFEVGAIGTGVAIGDYDGDGRPDIFVVSKTESCRLFRNLGSFKFEDVTEKAGVADHGDAARIWKQGVTFVDVNNDGRLDIYVCRYNAPNLLYINQGDGTFKEMAHAYGLDLNDASVMAAFCDYDRDGWLDVFVQTNLLNFNEHPKGQRNHLFHNNRNGTFTEVTDRAGISGEAQGHSATWWDFDGDGWPDLYVANDFAAPDKLYRNNRDGTFTDVIAQVVPHTPFSSMGSDLGDINNDGRVDFLATDMAATSHERDQRGMADSRARTIDLDPRSGEVPQYERNALYLNTGTGRCLEAACLAGIAATDWTWAVRFEDLDNDGRLDLVVMNGMHREANNSDLLARQMSAQTAAERTQVIRDSPEYATTHLAYRNLGDLKFEDVSAAWGLNRRGVSFGAAFGDLDGDGDLDLVYSNYRAGVTVLRNDSDSGHRVLVDLRGTVSNRFGIGALVRIETASGIQVRPLVLARGVLSSSEPVVHFGLGDDPVIRRMTINWPSGRVQVLENLPVDRRYRITEPSESPNVAEPAEPPALFREVSTEVGLNLDSKAELVDESATQRLLPFRLNRRGPYLARSHLADGSAVVAISGTTLTPLRLLRRGGDGRFQLLEGIPANNNATNDGPIAFVNLDENLRSVRPDDYSGRIIAGSGISGNPAQHLTLLVTKGGNILPAGSREYQPQLFQDDGRGKFHELTGLLPTLPINAGAVAIADFDRDGRQDVFIGGRVETGDYPSAPQSALLRNVGGRLEDVTDAIAPGLSRVGMVTAAVWADVDGDGWPDLVLTLDWGQVKYFHNRSGSGFEDWTERSGFASAGTGWWRSIAVADFNGDGVPDFVVGNVGLNTPYHASPDRPALLFVGDFAGRGEQPQLVEAAYEGDRLYPWRTRKELGAVIPSILKKYPHNNTFARAPLDEVLGAGALAAAGRYAVTELRSGILLSQPDGTYRFEPLPKMAQIAPITRLVAGDFDRNFRMDVIALQNSAEPIPYVGNFDGGLGVYLRGDGKGGFTAESAQESGIAIPGFAQDAVVLRGDGNDRAVMVVVTRFDGATMAFLDGDWRVDGLNIGRWKKE
ncbi:MAG TPA: VCBS repeat-containing protein [Candidatus Didemnitutus sp.]|nr:VCBS repeat-containing protein [Candidatus Didemnitutus sp.]